MSKKETDNFQDEAMDREYSKGRAAGAQSKKKQYRRGKRGGSGSGKRASSSYPITRGGSDKVNDPNWNAPTAQILKDANSLPFSHVVGAPYQIQWRAQTPPVGNIIDTSTSTHNIMDPGIIKIQLMSSLGFPKNLVAPVTTAGNAIYSFVRHMNSGARNYDAPDMMMYLFGMGECFAFYSWMCRVYGLLSYYQFYNRYVPKYLINAMNVNFESIIANMADFRVYINNFGYRLQSFCIPSGIDYVERHQWLYRDVYTDADSTKAQLYFFNPAGFYIWNEGTQPGPGFFTFNLLDTVKGDEAPSLVLSGIKNFGDRLLGPINGSEDFNMMSGDILKAFGANKIFKVNPITEAYTVTPIFSKEVLSEIENATPLFQNLGGINPIQARITHDPSINGGQILENVYVASPMIDPTTPQAPYSSSPMEISFYSQFNKAILNMHMNDPQPADITVATNLKNYGYNMIPRENLPSWTSNSPTMKYYQPFGVRSEICLQASLYVFITDDTVSKLNFNYNQPNFQQLVDASGKDDQTVTTADKYAVSEMIEGSNYARGLLNMITQFDWAPMVFPVEAVSGRWVPATTTVSNQVNKIHLTQSAPIADFENVTFIERQTLESMHESALLGLLTCREMPAFNIK